MKRRVLAVLAAVVMAFLFAHSAQAGLIRVNLDVFTTNYPAPAQQQLNIWMPVQDIRNSNGPDFVKTITVNAPDGSVFNLHPAKDWLPYDRAYWKALYAADFIGGKIVGGTYKVTVVPLVAPGTIVETDAITGAFLPTPVVTSPAPGATGVTATPTLSWNAVTGATYYRIQLWNNSWNEPVYWTWEKQARTDFTSFKIPLGELQPNCQYKFRIEARSGSQDMDMRSRSDWVTFTTGSW
jgi:hypothetical protein